MEDGTAVICATEIINNDLLETSSSSEEEKNFVENRLIWNPDEGPLSTVDLQCQMRMGSIDKQNNKKKNHQIGMKCERYIFKKYLFGHPTIVARAYSPALRYVL